MIFWTWAKGLEDEFDGSNRRNLRHFISTEVQLISEKPTRPASPTVPGDDWKDGAGLSEMNTVTLEGRLNEDVSLFLHGNTPTTMTQRTNTLEEKNSQKEGKMALVRLPTCAIFHKTSAGKGAPHTFYGFLRQWPSVPRIVVSTHVPIPGIYLTNKSTRFSYPPM